MEEFLILEVFADLLNPFIEQAESSFFIKFRPTKPEAPTIVIFIYPQTARVSLIRKKHKENMDIYSIRKKVDHSSVRTTERYLG